MIQIASQMRIVAAVEPADFRRGIDGLARLCKDVLKHDPFNGFDYLAELDRHASAAWGAPQNWMPWNYRETREGMESCQNAP
jgi:hypothetical protein